MNVEEARKIANEQFVAVMQPLIDAIGEKEEVDSESFERQVEELKVSLKEETGYEVNLFWVNPLPLGVYEVTTVFMVDAKRVEKEIEDAPALPPG